MDPSSQFMVPTIIDVPELIVTNEDIDFEDQHIPRASSWLKKIKILASAPGYIIGLGNVWRFPYLCYKHGGGAFLLAYTLMLLLVGHPLFLMELAFGQYANESPITIWRISPAFEGIGYVMCLISIMVAIYYNVIIAWIIHYLLGSFNSAWSDCNNSWNSAKCFFKQDTPTMISDNCTVVTTSDKTDIPGISDSLSNGQISASNISSYNDTDSILYTGNCTKRIDTQKFERIINTTYDVILPTNEYFHNQVLGISVSISELGSLNWDSILFLILAYGMIFLIIMKGLRLDGHLAIASIFIPYLIFITLMVRALTLEGALNGIGYYLVPDWDRFKDIEIWADATTQIFFALMPCWGEIITLASMNKFHDNFQSDAMLIILVNYGTALFLGLVSFSILGFMSNYSGIALKDIVDSGPGFIFMVYPEALAKLPMANLNSLIFFGILLLLGFTTQLTVIETVITTIVDTWPHKLRYRRPLVLMILCTSMFVVSLTMCFGNGFYILQLMDCFVGTFTAITVGILELIAIAWVYGMENFMQDIDDMISVHRNLFPSKSYWYFMWRYLTPSVLFAILLFSFTDYPLISYQGIEQPVGTRKFGWIFTLICVSFIPAMLTLRFLLSPGGSWVDKISYICRPSEDWAPSSYISGPKLINRHILSDGTESGTMYSSARASSPYVDHDQDSNDSNEDLKVVNGRANYIIPEEEEDTDTGLITNETNV